MNPFPIPPTCLFGILGGAILSAAEPVKPNIVLILADDLG